VGDKASFVSTVWRCDSSVVAAYFIKQLAIRLHLVFFVDKRLLRLNEGDQVHGDVADNMGGEVIRVDAEDLSGRLKASRS